jgi:hypothetical protein
MKEIALLPGSIGESVGLINRVRDFFDRTPRVKRDEDGVYVKSGGNEYRAATLGDLEAHLRRLSTEIRERGGSGMFESEQIPSQEIDVADAVTPNRSPNLSDIESALAAVQNERQKQQGLP